jgi:hypothetical protein|tara:strand:- start:2659 stop:3018 length:360 start_codon:yes stop_codon:yes gene_type:complete
MGKKLGKNAQIFCDHIQAGLSAAGIDPEAYPMSVVTDKETGETGFLISQVPLSEMREEDSLESSDPIVCWENRVSWHFEEHAADLVISEKQPASKCAVMFLGAMLTGGTIPAQKCQECE